MPYIEQSKRDKFKEALSKTPYISSSGELNYILTKLCLDYMGTNDHSYKTLNDVIGVLSCIQMELYRRIIAVYEDEKLKQNGDLTDMEDV